ncbi:MAG: AhpC/TSA family protein [Chitinophagaceae bacterium]|nr:AhpC/TSA family protein [Chitinophagaceae bacterium]
MKIRRLHFVLPLLFMAITMGGKNLWAQVQAKLVLAGTVKGVSDDTPAQLLASSMQGWSSPAASVKGGIFTIEVNLPQPDMFILVFGNPSEQTSPRYQLFLDNELVEISVDVTANTLQINSGATPVAFTELMNSFGPQFDALSTIAKQRQQAGQNGYASDSLASAWDKQLASIAQMIPGFIQKHPNTPVAAFLLNTVWQLYNNVAQMDQWIALTGDRAKESIFGKSLEQQMSGERLLGYGQIAPDFIQNDPEGKPVSLKEFRGKYVLVDFWASWCGPCRMENPNVVQAYQRYKSKNFTVLGISLDRDKPKWLQAIKDDNLTWPHVSDLKFWQNEVAQLYQVSSIPQNFLLDPEGRIIGKNLRGAALDQFLEKTLGNN